MNTLQSRIEELVGTNVSIVLRNSVCFDDDIHGDVKRVGQGFIEMAVIDSKTKQRGIFIVPFENIATIAFLSEKKEVCP